MSYHNGAKATSVLGRGHYLTDSSRPLRATVAGPPPQLIAPVLGERMGDYGWLDVRPEDQALAGPKLIAPRLGVADYGWLEVRPEDQLLGLDGHRHRKDPWGRTYPSRVDGLGDDAKKAELKRARLQSVLSPALVTKLNDDFSAFLRPVSGAIDALPISVEAKTELKTRPFDSLIDIFDPIEDIVSGAIARVNASTGKNTRNFFGTVVDMRVNQPGDNRLDTSTLNLVKRLRTIQQFMVLIILDPIDLGVELAATTSESVFHVRLQSSVLAVAEKQKAAMLAKPWTGHVETVVSQAPAGAEILGTDADGTHFRKPPGAVNGSYFVKRPSTAGLRGYGMGLGFPIPVAATAEVAPPVAAATAPVGVGFLDALIATIITAATTAAGSAISVVTFNAITQAGNAATSAGTKLLSPATKPAGTAPGTGPTPTPVLSPPVIRPTSGTVSASSGFPIVPVAIGAAVLGFLFLSGRDAQRSRRMREAA